RPKQVGAWVAAARGKRRADVGIPDAAAYAMGWHAWWDSLQPKWRKKDKDGKWSVDECGEGGREWGSLYQCVVNGSLHIVASLYFWGCAVSGQDA
ncbi:hypothetical protein FB451DRAFT_984530, partial [Mycena latifolia]